MKITDEIIIKYLDLIIKDASDLKSFGIMDLLHEKHLSTDSDESREFFHTICDNVSETGRHLGYIKSISKENTWFKLTEKGKRVKKFGGHYNYLKSIKEQKAVENNLNITNNFNNSTIGQVIQESNVSDNKIENNLTSRLNNESKKKLILGVLWVTITENKLIVGIVLLIIEEFSFKVIFNFLKSFFN